MERIHKVTTFKERFAILCNESEKTITDLSKELHVSNQTISAWKLGTRSPKEPTVIAIANHFHVSVEWLLGFNVPKYKMDMKLDLFGNAPDESPKTPEAKAVSFGMDSLPEEQRKLILKMVKAMFPDTFTKGTDDDET